MKFLRPWYCLLLALGALCACAPVTMKQVASQGGVVLSKPQLQELLADHTLHLESIDLDAQVHYLPDGHLSATSLQGDKESGKWSLSDADELCMKFAHWYYGDLKCYKVFREKNSYIFFTANGARAYTATSPTTSNIAARGPASDTSTSITAEQDDSPAAPLNQEESKHNLLSLARNCPDCDLAGIELVDAQLVAANLAGANLSGANLSGAQLMGTNLAGANLRGADLTDADLTGSNLIRANVTDAKLSGAVLLGAHLESIEGLKE